MRYRYDDDDFLLDKNMPAAMVRQAHQPTARSSQINIKNSFLKKIKKLLMDGVSACSSHDVKHS